MSDVEEYISTCAECKETVERLGFKIKRDMYDLVKVGEKKPSSLGYPSEYLALRHGSPSFIGDNERVMLYVTSMSRWFKTSTVLSVTEIETGYKIETKNSFYELRRL